MSSVSELSGLKAVALDRLAWARNYAEQLLAGLRDDQLTARAGGKGNHALWVMGHLALAEDMLVSRMTGAAPQLPEEHQRLFAPGSEPTNAAADYPPRAELLERMRSTRRRVVAWVESLDEESARRPTEGRLQRFAPDAISAAFTIASHETFHAGQVAAIRAALGMPRVLL
jgi:uncharacterized damage-inducible protein DinB